MPKLKITKKNDDVFKKLKASIKLGKKYSAKEFKKILKECSK